MRRLKSRLVLSKSKRIIKSTKSQRMATSRALKSLKEPSRFIKKELTIQLLTMSFVTVSFLTQEPMYTFSTIELDSSAISSLRQSKSTQARIQSKSQAMAQLQSRLTTQKGRGRYSSQEQPLYQASTLTQYASKSSMIKASIGTTKRTLFSMATMRRTPAVATMMVRTPLNTMSQRETHWRPHLRLNQNH